MLPKIRVGINKPREDKGMKIKRENCCIVLHGEEMKEREREIEKKERIKFKKQ